MIDLKFEHKKSAAAEAATTQASIPMPQAVSLMFENDNKNLIIIVLALLAPLTLSTLLLKKYRQRIFSRFADAIPQMDDTLLDFVGH